MEHVAQAPAWAAALEASGFGVFARQSAWAYPAANLLHLLGLILLAGPIALLDLRMLGLARSRISVEDASRVLTPFGVAGLMLLAASGPLMYAADAKALAGSTVMWAKLALVAVATANAALFNAFWRSRYPTWDGAPPLIGRLQAAASLAIWLVVAALGRMVAYL